MFDKFEQLSEEIKRDYPSITARLTKFPTGAVMLDVPIGEETYVVEYLPSFNAFGISRVSAATFGWEGVENAFETFEATKAHLLHLLGENSKT